MVDDQLDMRIAVSNYRRRAEAHFQEAKALLEQAEKNAGIYACLQLRLSIEALMYSMLALYHGELNNSGIRKWQPKRVMDELLAIDPQVEGSMSISIQDDATGEWQQIGSKDHRLTASWTTKAHNALGNALHTPTLGNLSVDENDLDLKYRERAEKYIPELGEVFASTTFNLYFKGKNRQFECTCGAKLIRREDRIKSESVLTCWSCARIWDTVWEGDEVSITPHKVSYTCPKCSSKNAFQEIELSENFTITCHSCGLQGRVSRPWQIGFQPFEVNSDKTHNSTEHGSQD